MTDNEEQIPSDLTDDDYHSRRKESYFFHTTEEEQDQNNEELPHSIHDNYAWNIIDESSIDVTQLCYQFKENTLKLSNRPEQLSDTRLLALHDVYLSGLSDQSKPVGKYWFPSTYYSNIHDIAFIVPRQAEKSAGWCTDMSLKRYRSWIAGLANTTKYLSEATEASKIVEIHCMQAAIDLVPTFISSPLGYFVESTNVHNWITPLLKPIFSCEPLLSIEWANKFINQYHKPYLTASVKGIGSWLPIVVGEFKNLDSLHVLKRVWSRMVKNY